METEVKSDGLCGTRPGEAMESGRALLVVHRNPLVFEFF